MARYLSIANYKGHSVKAIPVGIRRLPIVGDWFPFYVGDRVVFDVIFKALPEDKRQYTENPLSDYALWEIHPDVSYRGFQSMMDANNEEYRKRFTSVTTTQHGDFRVFLGLAGNPDPKAPVFTTEIFSKERQRFEIFIAFSAVLVGFILSCMLAVLLGFIHINPFWELFLR